MVQQSIAQSFSHKQSETIGVFTLAALIIKYHHAVQYL